MEMLTVTAKTKVKNSTNLFVLITQQVILIYSFKKNIFLFL